MRKTYKSLVFLYVFRKSSPLRANRPARAKDHRQITKIDMFGLPKWTPNRLKIDKIFENRAQVAEFRDLRTKLDAGSAPRAPKIAQERPKSGPRALQERPKSAQGSVGW